MIVFRSLILSLLLLAALSCQKSNSTSTSPPLTPIDKKYLQISLSTEVVSLDPSIGVDFPSAFITRMLFEGLMIIGPEGTVRPAIAQSYELSDDYKTYTFHLRPSKWSNGDPITAYDFEYSWKKVIDPKTASDGVHNFYPIKNALPASLGEIPLDSVGIKALDRKTLVVELEHPTPYFPEVVATPSYLPVNAKVDRENRHWANTEGKQFVCNGPYILIKHRLENEIIVKKNPTYWDADSVKMPGISIAIIKDEMTQLNLFKKKELDWLGKPLSKIPLDAIAHLRMHKKIQFMKTLGLYWYFINTESFPFNNKKMRKAFAYAINRDLICRYILQGKEIPATGALPYYLSTQEIPFFKDNDQGLALQLFNEALKELGVSKEDLPEITINHFSSPAHLRVAAALQESWSLAFGISVKLEHQDWKAHYAKLQNGNYQIGGMFWQSWLRDPIYTLQTFRCKGGVNMSRWENENYQNLLLASEQETDLTKRKALFNEAETLLMEEMPVIPVYFSTIAYAKNDSLHDVFISDLYEVDFRWSYFKE